MIASLGVLSGFVLFRYVFPRYEVGIGSLAGWLSGTGLGAGVGEVGVAFVGLISLFSIGVYYILPVIAGSLFAGLRRLEREKLLRDLAREEGPGSDRYLQALEQALDSRFEDVGLHLKYAEALFARGRVKEAAVECRLLLKQDPYNFNGNLLLANAYYSLGLDAECAEVCDAYLGVSGYCFEFSELREQARQRTPA
jgi:hypothetical protein